jgi:MFS transporter
LGLIAVLAGITYGIQPYGGHTMGWTSPLVIGLISGGLAVLGVFCAVETRVAEPMFRLSLFRIRPFTAGNLASLLAGLGRGGLIFTLIIWLQGIYLPMHGYGFSQTLLWAGIAMLPLTVGILTAGPVSGWLSDRYGARPFATGGMLLAAASFVLLELLPVDFAYWQFAGILLLNGIGMGLFASPNRAGIMNSLPPDQRGVGAGMSRTFRLPHRPHLLPVADRGAVLPWAGHRLRLRHRGVPDRGHGLAAARPQVRARGTRRARAYCRGPGRDQGAGAGQPVTTWKVARVGSAAYAIRPPSVLTSRRAASASAVMSSPGASTGTPGG